MDRNWAGLAFFTLFLIGLSFYQSGKTSFSGLLTENPQGILLSLYANDFKKKVRFYPDQKLLKAWKGEAPFFKFQEESWGLLFQEIFSAPLERPRGESAPQTKEDPFELSVQIGLDKKLATLRVISSLFGDGFWVSQQDPQEKGFVAGKAHLESLDQLKKRVAGSLFSGVRFSPDSLSLIHPLTQERLSGPFGQKGGKSGQTPFDEKKATAFLQELSQLQELPIADPMLLKEKNYSARLKGTFNGEKGQLFYHIDSKKFYLQPLEITLQLPEKNLFTLFNLQQTTEIIRGNPFPSQSDSLQKFQLILPIGEGEFFFESGRFILRRGMEKKEFSKNQVDGFFMNLSQRAPLSSPTFAALPPGLKPLMTFNWKTEEGQTHLDGYLDPEGSILFRDKNWGVNYFFSPQILLHFESFWKFGSLNLEIFQNFSNPAKILFRLKKEKREIPFDEENPLHKNLFTLNPGKIISRNSPGGEDRGLSPPLAEISLQKEGESLTLLLGHLEKGGRLYAYNHNSDPFLLNKRSSEFILNLFTSVGLNYPNEGGKNPWKEAVFFTPIGTFSFEIYSKKNQIATSLFQILQSSGRLDRNFFFQEDGEKRTIHLIGGKMATESQRIIQDWEEKNPPKTLTQLQSGQLFFHLSPQNPHGDLFFSLSPLPELKGTVSILGGLIHGEEILLKLATEPLYSVEVVSHSGEGE